MINDYECWYCNNIIPIRHEPQERIICEKCSETIPNNIEKLFAEYKKLKKQVMFEKALKLLEKSKVYMYEYKRASTIVYDSIFKDGNKFDSSHEVAAAIILTDYNYKFKNNYEIMNYKVDFYIPELKVCLEIDGRLHKNSKLYDNSRDVDIRNNLGKQWEIIRIPTKMVEERPTYLVDAIELMYKKKKEIRSKNHGILPEYYSEREKTHYNNILFK